MKFRWLVSVASVFLGLSLEADEVLLDRVKQFDISNWYKAPAGFAGVSVEQDKLVLNSGQWGYLFTKSDYTDYEAEVTFTILDPANRFDFRGTSWCVWSDYGYNDGGYEFGIVLRGGEKEGYRVQVSYKYQEIVLFKYHSGSYLQVAPCKIKLHTGHKLKASITGNKITVRLDDEPKIIYYDNILHIKQGKSGIGVNSGGKVAVENIKTKNLPTGKYREPKDHTPEFSVVTWRNRKWIFDGKEPIMLLYAVELPYNQEVKMMPGYKPVIMWNAHWDIARQGSWPEGLNTLSEPEIAAGGTGDKVEINYEGRHNKGCFITKTKLTAGYDGNRKVYTYDVDSRLEVLPGKSFNFGQGFDFCHNTGLDPFNWEYLIIKRDDGIYYRPLYPLDPGQYTKLAKQNGLIAWYGRRGEPFILSPVIELNIPETEKRELVGQTCGWAYDGTFNFPAENAKEGTKIVVKVRYTAYPAEEIDEIFKTAKVIPLPGCDPDRYFIFSDECWPKVTFNKFLPLNKPWPKGRAPFLTRHNSPLGYCLEKDTKFGAGYAMKLWPKGYAAASLPAPAPIPAGKYIVSGYVKGNNVHGPGGYIEIISLAQHTGNDFVRLAGKILKEERHYVGNGTFNWRKTGFVSSIVGGSPALAIGFGNDGTGEILFNDVEFTLLKEQDKIPAGILSQPQNKPLNVKPSPEGAVADYRFEEGKGAYAYDYAGGIGVMELSNIDRVTDNGISALKFDDYKEGRETLGGNIYNTETLFCGGNIYNIFPQVRDNKKATFGLAGTPYKGTNLSSFTISVWVKPADKMKPAYWGSDILGYGSRDIKLILREAVPPYTLGVSLHFQEYIWADLKLSSDNWYHIAVTGKPGEDKRMKICIYVDGKLVKEAVSEKFSENTSICKMLVVGAEIYNLNCACYRGLIGPITIYNKALNSQEIAESAKR